MRSKIAQKIVNETDDKVKEKVNVFADMTALDSWLEKHKNEEIDAMVEKDIKFFDLLDDYFYYKPFTVGDEMVDKYNSKDGLFIIENISEGRWSLFCLSRDLNKKVVSVYNTVLESGDKYNISLESGFLQYLRIKLLSFCE